MTDAIRGATNRQGQPCRRAPMVGGACGRCKLHGGASLVGPASPAFRHGRSSKFLPSRLAAKYQELLADPDLLTLAGGRAVPGGLSAWAYFSNQASVDDLLDAWNYLGGGG